MFCKVKWKDFNLRWNPSMMVFWESLKLTCLVCLNNLKAKIEIHKANNFHVGNSHVRVT